MTSTPVTADVKSAVSRSAGVLRARPSALLFDFDGTLSELVDDPADASIEVRSETALHELAKHVDVVGIVTGRAAMDVITRLDASDLVVVGNHGLEKVVKGEHVEHEAGVQAAEAVDAAMAEIRERLVRDSLDKGVIFENKRLSGSIHYRMAPNQKQVGSVLIPLARKVAAANGLRLTEGKLIVELRPTAEISKGTAIRQLREEYGLASIVFLGDDLTDVDGFLAMRDMRDTSEVDTIAVGVLGRDSHEQVAMTCDVAVTEIHGVADYLEQLLAVLEGEDNA